MPLTVMPVEIRIKINKHKHTQKFSAKIVFQKLKAQTEASDISSCQDQAREERVEIDRPVGSD